jgi:hypothetical protein
MMLPRELLHRSYVIRREDRAEFQRDACNVVSRELL